MAFSRMVASAIPRSEISTAPAVSVPWRRSNERSTSGLYVRSSMITSRMLRFNPALATEYLTRRIFAIKPDSFAVAT